MHSVSFAISPQALRHDRHIYEANALRPQALAPFLPHESRANSVVPFIDNILHVGRLGVKYVAAPMGSQNDSAVAATCEDLGITCKRFLTHNKFSYPANTSHRLCYMNWKDIFRSSYNIMARVKLFLEPEVLTKNPVVEQSIRLFHH